MRKIILATVALASLAAPLAAQAYQSEVRDDRRDVREQTRQLNDAQRRGDRGDIRDERRDVAGARRELREDINDRRDDRRDNYRDDRRGDHRDDRRGDWRNDRGDGWHENRGYGRPGGWDGRRYNAGRYDYPRGYGYRAWAVGGFLPRSYWGERYWVARPVAYGLPYAGPGTRWIRVGPDALLIRNFNGSVIRVARGIFY